MVSSSTPAVMATKFDENEYDSAEGSAVDFSEVNEAIRTAEVQAKLMLEQEAGEAMAAKAAEMEKKGLEKVLQQGGASAEEKKVTACGDGVRSRPFDI